VRWRRDATVDPEWLERRVEMYGMRERVWLANERLLPLEREFPDSYDRETTRIVFAIRSLAQYINDEANNLARALRP
jgi:hypothetical protein